MEKNHWFIGIYIVAFAVWLMVGCFFFFYYRRQHKQEIRIGQDGAVTVPLTAAFSGLRYMPDWWAFGANNLNPKLVLSEAGIEYRVFFVRQKAYSEIEKVDATSSWKGNILFFYFRNSTWTFIANVGEKNKLEPVLKFLKQKGVPLTEQAESYLLVLPSH